MTTPKWFVQFKQALCWRAEQLGVKVQLVSPPRCSYTEEQRQRDLKAARKLGDQGWPEKTVQS
jgi:hypothetical protein